jgi:hypothetical protein
LHERGQFVDVETFVLIINTSWFHSIKNLYNLNTSGESAGGPLSMEEKANSGLSNSPIVIFWFKIDGGFASTSH